MSKPERRTAGEVAGVSAGQPELTKRRKQPGYYPVTGYRISPKIKDQVKELAKELKASPSDLAGLLLQYALDAYQKGELKFDLKPEKYSLSLK